MKVLFAWIGQTDLNASTADDSGKTGPIQQALQWRSFDAVHLLSNYPPANNERFLSWLEGSTGTKAKLHEARLTSPTSHREIYEAVDRVLKSELVADPRREVFFHLSPGTPAMASIWLLLGKTAYPATLLQSSLQRGVEVAEIPFVLSADFLAAKLEGADADLIALSLGLPPRAPEFDGILHASDVMKEVILKARRVAPRTLPVLLLGESGVGKELFARAIHQSSPRKGARFVAVNCGAVPQELVDSELFGHERGAFTGATQSRAGYVEEASGGTLFLDEIGELPLKAQVRLLRVLQEREVTRVGSTKPKKVDFRLIAATHRDLAGEVAAGRFREDLFHRIAVAVLKIPPLRERGQDLSLLLDHYLSALNDEAKGEVGHVEKKLSAAARNLLLKHPYPGNVRELINILQRAIVWSPRPSISLEDIRESILTAAQPADSRIMGRPVGEGFQIREVLAEVARHYLEKALAESGGNKTKAAGLLGLGSHTSLKDWMKRYGLIDEGPD